MDEAESSFCKSIFKQLVDSNRDLLSLVRTWKFMADAPFKSFFFGWLLVVANILIHDLIKMLSLNSSTY